MLKLIVFNMKPDLAKPFTNDFPNNALLSPCLMPVSRVYNNIWQTSG